MLSVRDQKLIAANGYLKEARDSLMRAASILDEVAEGAPSDRGPHRDTLNSVAANDLAQEKIGAMLIETPDVPPAA